MNRTIRVENAVDAEMDDARRSWARLDDAWAVIEWVLAHDPTKGTPLTESGLARSFVYDGSIAHQMPTIQVIYVDENPYLTIKAIRITAPVYTAGNA